MSIKVKYDHFSTWAEHFSYGKQISDLPDQIIDAIDDSMDGQEFESDAADDFVINSLTQSTTKEALENIDVDIRDYSDNEEALAENRDQIISYLSDNFIYLGEDHGIFYYAQ